MSKRQILMLIGVWVVILAAPGFPSAARTALMIVTGVGIVIFGYKMAPAGARPKQDLPFTDYKKSDEPPAPQAAPNPGNEGTVA